MHSPGHIGIGLIAYAPLGYLLAPIAEPAVVFLGMFVAVLSAILPDIDGQLPIDHRGMTHTVLFVAVTASVAAGIAAGISVEIAASRRLGAAFVGTVAFLGTSSHLLADGITPMGITPFWPLSNRHYTLDAVPSKHRGLNVGFLLTGVVASGPLVFRVIR